MAQNSALCGDCRNGEARLARAQQAPFVQHPRGHWLRNGCIDFLTVTFPYPWSFDEIFACIIKYEHIIFKHKTEFVS